MAVLTLTCSTFIAHLVVFILYYYQQKIIFSDDHLQSVLLVIARFCFEKPAINMREREQK